ncbi:MAG: hypothetical protein RL654_1179 [Pseudomonadota bacterium]|jgi:uncharacterized iron-regulated membrane protein
MRSRVVVVHRWVGLVMAGFLLIAGLTGSLLVWYHELDVELNPALMQVQRPSVDASRLDPLTLRERVQAAYPQAWVHWVTLREGHADEAVSFWVEGAANADGVHADLGFDEVFVNPYTGTITGTRRWGDLSQGVTNLMPFIHRLHHSLALGTVGTWIFGVIAVLWTIDCFVGVWLTLPARSKASPPSSPRQWFRRWAPAWKLRIGAGPYKLNHDLHRAGGLWPWAALFVLAWSSVAFNLYDPVYRPVMDLFFDMRPDPRASLPRLAQDAPEPAMGWSAALERGRQHMNALARDRDLRILAEDRLSYDPHRGVLRLEVRSHRDVSQRRGRTAIYVDARNGKLLACRLPTGEAAGDTVTAWLLNLHMAHLWGWPWRLFITLMGLVVALLSGTGLYIWWKKRRSRRLSALSAASPAARHTSRPPHRRRCSR